MTTPRVPNALVRNPHLQGVADHAQKPAAAFSGLVRRTRHVGCPPATPMSAKRSNGGTTKGGRFFDHLTSPSLKTARANGPPPPDGTMTQTRAMNHAGSHHFDRNVR